MSKAWYLREYEDKPHLHNIVLSAKEYTKKLPSHDHCELCWARFSLHPDDHHFGYFDSDSESWICVDCFQELSNLFGWTTE